MATQYMISCMQKSTDRKWTSSHQEVQGGWNKGWCWVPGAFRGEKVLKSHSEEDHTRIWSICLSRAKAHESYLKMVTNIYFKPRRQLPGFTIKRHTNPHQSEFASSRKPTYLSEAAHLIFGERAACSARSSCGFRAICLHVRPHLQVMHSLAKHPVGKGVQSRGKPRQLIIMKCVSSLSGSKAPMVRAALS